MKKKFYTWEECMQLREIKVCVTFDIRSVAMLTSAFKYTEFKEA
jgi:hypothetical protein